MKQDTRKLLEESARIHGEKMQEKGAAGQLKDWFADTWVMKGRNWLADSWASKLIDNDHNAGVIADTRRRVIEEGVYGKTLDDTVNRQNFNELERVPGEEVGWKKDSEYDKWLEERQQERDKPKAAVKDKENDDAMSM